MEERVLKVVSEATKVDAKELSNTTTFIDDLNLDSLEIVELMMKMEDEFSIEISDEDAEKLKSIEDVTSYLKSKLN
jgi:acyl carrier protein